MAYCVIIRGPLGVGKTEISKKLSKKLAGKYISIDSLLMKSRLDKVDKKENRIPVKRFIKATESIVNEMKTELKSGKIIIFDGNFYYKSQILYLKNSLNCKFCIFTLKAPLAVCIERDRRREKPYGRAATKAVYDLVSRLDYGTKINTENKTTGEVIKEILIFLPK